MKEVSQWVREQLIRARQRKEDQRWHLRAAVTFRVEDLEAVPPTVIAMPAIGSTATVSNDAEHIGTIPVHFVTSTSDALLTPPDARPATSQLTDASVTHSQFPHQGAPTSWSTFLEDVQSSSTMSLLLSMQQLPALMVKKPLCFRQPKKERRT